MKKILRIFLFAVLALCFSVTGISAAEAASVALLPLINNVQGDEIAGQVFYKEAIGAMNSKKGYVLVENDKLTAAIEAANVSGRVPDEATLAKIARDGDVEIVIAMQLDKLDDRVIISSAEDKLKLIMEGMCVSYNKLSGKFVKHRIYGDKMVPEATTARWDWTHEEWGRAVRREINRILNAKN